MRRHLRVSVSALACLTATSVGHAQTTSGPTPADTGVGAIGEIIVTAQRRSERLQDVPIAITAIGADRLDAQGIKSTQDLSMVTPGLTTPETAGYLQPHIRGVGTSSNGPGIENPVATYIDGVYLASAPASLLTLNNVARIEVLKGPQGTLFGRNATGGLIHIITKNPQETFGGSANLTYANYENVTGDLYVTGGLANNLSADLAVRYETQGEGWGRNLASGKQMGRLNYDFAGRTKFLLELSSDTQIRLALDYSRRRSSREVQHSHPAYRATFNNAFFGGPFPLGGAYDINSDLNPESYLEGGGAALQINHDFGSISLQSITAYRASRFDILLDIDLTPANTIALDGSARAKQFTQELQMSSSTSGPFTWVAGLYYFHARDSWAPLQIDFGPTLASPVPGVPTQVLDDDGQKTDSIAGYAQASYEVLPDTKVTGGLRYTYEKKSLAGVETFSIAGTPVAVTPIPAAGSAIPPSINFKKFNFRAAIDHKFGSAILGYLSYNTGFKSGGYNLSRAANLPYAPETIDAAEIGLKTQLFDRRLRFNVAAFHYIYTNIQVGRYVAGSVDIYNGAKAKIYGLDLDLDVVVLDRLTLNGGLSLIHARFKDFPNADYFTPIGGCVPVPGGVCTGSAKGNTLPYSPSYTVNLGGEYRHPLAGGKLILTANYYRSGRSFAAPDNYAVQEAYDLVDASLAWSDPSDRYHVRLWAKNIGKTVYASSLVEAGQGVVRALGAPRTYGITAGLRF